jgi:DNA polymerase I-like protein with 3'-5' exonuclease and polymerase domains
MVASNGFLAGYLACNWCTVPVHRPDPASGTCSCGKPDCPKPGKHPVSRFWPAGSTDPAHFTDRNIGVRLGPDSQNLADVDLDCGEAVVAGPALLPATDSAFGRGGQVTHLLYTIPARDALYLKLLDPVLTGDRATIVELRWPEWDADEERFKNLQTVFPPSLHSSGRTIEWLRDGAPAEVAGTELIAAVRHVGAAVLLARYARPKERHGLVLLLANLLVRAAWKDEPAVRFITAVFTTKNDQEMVTRVRDGEGLNAVKDARKRAKNGKPQTGLPALKEMLDPALGGDADKVVASVKEWLGVPDAPGPTVTFGAGPSGGNPGPAARPTAAPIPPATPFPVHLLPPVPRAYVAATAAAMNCDPSYSALPTLAALGAAIGGSHAASPKARWKEPPYVWALAVGKSGAIKSPPYRDVEDMAEDINDRLEAEHQKAMAIYEIELEQWEEARESGSDAGSRPEEPVKKTFIKGDVTIEALVGKLQENPRGLLIGQDELSAWIGSFVKYSGKTGASDLPRWLQLHHAGTVNYTRKTGEPHKREVRVRGVGVSVTGTIQPKVLSRVLTEEFRASGFLARLLLALPPWRKRQWTEAEVDEPTRSAFAALLDGLYQLPAGKWPNGKPAPHLVKLSPEAKARFVAFYNANGAALETADEDMSAVMSKLEGYALRFALIFHCCRLKEYAKDAPITPGDMAAAIELTRWFRDEAERVYLALGEPPEVQGARHLAEVVRKLAEKCGGRVTARNLQRFNCRKYPNSEAAETALERLVGLGFGWWETASASGKGGPPTRGYVPCMTHDTTPPSPDDDPPDEEGGADGLHDTTPDDDVPPFGGAVPGSDGTAVESDICGGAGETRSEVVSCVSCVIHDDKRLERIIGEGGAGTEGLCHAEGVVSCTGYELVREPDRLGEVVRAVRSASVPVGLDLETTGLSHARDRVRLLSLATPSGTFLVDVFRVDPSPVWPALAGAEVVGHNLGFDLPFLMKLGFVPGRVRDTMLASQVLHAGDRAIGHAIKDLTQRHLGINLDKEMQTANWSGSLSESHLEYAARDAEIPLALWEKLTAEIANANLTATVETEMVALPAVAWAAVQGVGFYRMAWEAVAAEAEARAGTLREQLDELVPNAGNLFGVTNWNSPEAVTEAFAGLGLTLESTDDDALAALDHPAAALLREYRAASKLSGTYGREWLRHVSPDGRVYATWKQIGAGASGRMSCKQPNLQQLPRDPRYRRCFIAPPGRVLVKADYSQIELRIAAKITGDKRMLGAYNRGEDLHTTTARSVLGKSEVTKADRQLSKSLNFGLLYGMGAKSLAAYATSNFGVSLTESEAAKHRDVFFRTYPGLRAWHRGVPNGTIQTRTLAGRRRVGVSAFTEKLNTPTQGSGADGLKRALALLWERRSACPGAFPVLLVHDEIVIECDETQRDEAMTWVRDAMRDGMAPLLDPVPVEVEVSAGRTWCG